MDLHRIIIIRFIITYQYLYNALVNICFQVLQLYFLHTISNKFYFENK